MLFVIEGIYSNIVRLHISLHLMFYEIHSGSQILGGHGFQLRSNWNNSLEGTRSKATPLGKDQIDIRYEKIQQVLLITTIVVVWQIC